MHAPLWVKIGMGLGFSFLALTVIDIFGTHVFHTDDVDDHMVAVDTHGAPASDHGTAPAEDAFDLAAAFAVANGNLGSVKKCVACHTFDQGGPNKIGPNLWSIVGSEKASVEGFKYSGTLRGLGGTWTYQDLFAFLSSPKSFAPGSKMSFAGFKRSKDAVNAIVYLRDMSDAPLPLPEVTAPEATVEHEGAGSGAEASEAGEADDNASPADDEKASIDASDETVEAIVEEAAAHAENAAPVGRFAEANLAAGEKVFKKCKACHTPKAGGANKVGPNLWNVVGRDKAAAEGFKFSAAMTSAGGTWSIDDLDAFLKNPRAFISGTKMSFAGLKREKDRTNVIAYLASLSDAPIELE